MASYFGCHTVLVKLLVALVFASMFISSECRLMVQEEDQNLHEKSVLELSSRDEIVRMAGYGEEKLSTILITGTVLCYKDCLAASNKHRELQPQHISGALVEATCTNTVDNKVTLVKSVTDEYGEFIIDLPSELHAIPNLDQACSVKILQLPKSSPCHQPGFARKQKEIKVSSLGNGIRTYTTGMIAFISKLTENSEACMKGLEDEQEMSW